MSYSTVVAVASGVDRSRTRREGAYCPMIPAERTFPRSIFHIPWIAYLSALLAFGIELPSEIRTERMPDGGLLMVATEERLDPDLPEHARRARILVETMIARAATGQAGKQ